jgi:hypothetical protein
MKAFEFGIIDLRGVGHNPNTFSTMGSAQGCRWYIFPLCIIPDGGQVSENSAKPLPWLLARATKQTCDVLQDDEPRSKVASKSEDFGIKPASRSLANASASARTAKVLAWESSGDDINAGNSIGSKSLCGKGADIVITGDIGPVLGEDFARERFDFAEGDGLETACSFKAKAKPSDAREKIEDAKLGHAATPQKLAGNSTAFSAAMRATVGRTFQGMPRLRQFEIAFGVRPSAFASAALPPRSSISCSMTPLVTDCGCLCKP